MLKMVLAGFGHAAWGAVEAGDLHDTTQRIRPTPLRLWLETLMNFGKDRVTYTKTCARFRKVVGIDGTLDIVHM